MKKLVGKIFQDENGTETIERINNSVSEWQIDIFDRCKPSLNIYEQGEQLYGYKITCPYCGNIYSNLYKNKAYRDKKIQEVRYDPANTYCGFCGHKNIHE